jgi:hypothetical protein
MSIAFYLFIVLGFGLIGFAIYKKDSVRASFKLHSIGFSLEAKDNERKKPVLPSS